MKIFVTGAAGFIGSHLCEALLKKEHTVIGFDNLNDFYSPALKKKNLEEIQETAKHMGQSFEFIKGDICERKLVDAAIVSHSPQAIVHLAAMAGVRPSIQNPVLYEKVNGLGTLHVLEAAKESGITQFVFGSSSSVYGLNVKVPFSEEDPVLKPYSPYASTKRSGELSCHVYHRLYSMNIACLRFFTVYGPRQRPDLAIRKFTDLIYQNKTIPIYGDGSYARDYTYVDDIMDGVLKSLDWVCSSNQEPRYDIFNLGESATTTVLDLLALLEKCSGKKAKKEFFPPVPGDVPITYADITKSKKILGYHPQTSLEEGIPKFMEWYEKSSLS